MSARTGAVSDADQIIADQMAAVAEPSPHATVIDTETGDTAGVPGESLEQALEAIRPHGPQHVWRPAGRTCSRVNCGKPGALAYGGAVRSQAAVIRAERPLSRLPAGMGPSGSWSPHFCWPAWPRPY